MSQHRYPVAALYSDYLRVAVGLSLTGGPLVLLDLAAVPAALLAGLAGLFIWFGVRTAVRQLSAIELSPEAIAVHGPPFDRHLAWRQLEGLKLAYYAPRRTRSDGWLQLTLRGSRGRPIRIESVLDGFDQVLRRSLRAAAANGLFLDPTTQANLAALGFAAEVESSSKDRQDRVSRAAARPD